YNHVTINSTKTVTMHFCTSKKDVPAPNVTIGTQSLQVVKSTKLLGITIDDQLDWKQHVTNTVRAASYRLYMLRRLRSLGTPEKELKNIYSTFILPKLCYASPAWTPSNLTQKPQLEKVQKRACNITVGSSYSNYEDALTILNLPKLSDHNKETLRKFGLKLCNPRHRNLLPSKADRPARATIHHNRLKPFKAPRTDRYKHSHIPSIGLLTCFHALANLNRCSIPRRFKVALENLGNDEDLVITSADKGGEVVILNRTDYNIKMMDLLNDTSTYEKKPLGNAEREGLRFKKEARRILMRTNRGKKLVGLLEEAPRPPRMRGLPKTHKPGIPMRPITSGPWMPQAKNHCQRAQA
ncbi:uncharacterized protein LOC143019081, partial [Oratosquilla oratoria]|uniref:uncharacterized protein LOC143019081 n=1 Tax=Oratosquilla oratoria TaxID=337810 RepID=UPI003F76B351